MLEKLTEKELQVIELVSQGLSNEEIAEKMFIAITTVKTHLANIYLKFGVSQKNNETACVRVRAVLYYLNNLKWKVNNDNTRNY